MLLLQTDLLEYVDMKLLVVGKVLDETQQKVNLILKYKILFLKKKKINNLLKIDIGKIEHLKVDIEGFMQSKFGLKICQKILLQLKK
jgi:hypothetical protein